MGKYRNLILIAGAVVILDQITKQIIIHTLEEHGSVTIIPGFFSLTHVYNPGGAFGFAAGQSALVRTILFLVIATMALGFIFYFYMKAPENDNLFTSTLSLIFGGAMGNIIDRIRFGSVVDFLDFKIMGFHWPAFNVADSAISIGMAIFIFLILSNKMPE